MFYSSPYLSKGFNSVQAVGYTLGWRLNTPRMRSVPQGVKTSACLCLHFVGLVAVGLGADSCGALEMQARQREAHVQSHRSWSQHCVGKRKCFVQLEYVGNTQVTGRR